MTVKWSEMASRERDALVAEKVMGYKFVRFADVIVRYTGEDYFADNAERKVFSPSTDIAAAWEVVEKMVERHFYVQIDTRYVQGEANGWNVLIGREEEDADTLPEAICKAALLAVGVDID